MLWLGELRQYADADGGAAVLGRLADLLQGEGHLVITTMWPEHWNTYTAAARAGPGAADPAGTAGRLLERLPELTGRDPARIDPARGGVIDVPDRFTTAEMAAAARTGDPLLAEAAAAAASAGQDGQVTQYLAGVPDLLDRYDGPGGDPYGQAIITAAMDATRLGHASPLPAALLQEAAVGYLTGPQRTKDIASWRDTALAWATDELNGAVRALQPVPPPSGTGVAGYQVADYLDQHGRRTRQDQLGPASLWDALTAHAASAGDLTRLGQAARDRGLYRHAAALWTTAVTLGSTDAARQLINHLRQVSPGDTTRAARWAVGHVSLDNPRAVAGLLRELREAGASDAVTALAGPRPPATPASTTRRPSPSCCGSCVRPGPATRSPPCWPATRRPRQPRRPGGRRRLLRELREAGASDAVTALLARDRRPRQPRRPGGRRLAAGGAARGRGQRRGHRPAGPRPAGHASLDDPGAVAWLLRELRAAGAGDAVTARWPATRRPRQPRRPGGRRRLLRALREAGAGDAVTALATRAAGHASLDDPGAVAVLLRELREAGASDAVTALAARAAGHASLDDPGAVAALLGELREAGASDAVTALLARDPAGHASLDDPGAVAWLLGELREAGASDAVTALLARDPAGHASLDDPGAVAGLLEELREAGASDAVTALAARAAGHASLDNPGASPAAARSCARPGPATRSPPCWPATPPATPASTTRGPSPSCWGSCARPGPATRSCPAARDPPATPASTTRRAVAGLLEELREAGASDAVTALATRAANAGMFDLFLEVRPDEASSYLFGREPDGTPSQSWNWQEPTGRTRKTRVGPLRSWRDCEPRADAGDRLSAPLTEGALSGIMTHYL